MKKLVIRRIPEEEIMSGFAQSKAYASANFSESNKIFVDSLVAEFGDLNNNKILDIGIGDGEIPISLAMNFPGIKIYGIDGSQEMLNHAKQKISKNKLQKRIFLNLIKLQDNPYPEMKFDNIISNSVLHHVDNPNFFWELISKRLSSNGRFLVMDLLRPESIAKIEMLVNKYASNEPEILQKDFYNSLLASYDINELRGQLVKYFPKRYRINIVSDRHFVVFN